MRGGTDGGAGGKRDRPHATSRAAIVTDITDSGFLPWSTAMERALYGPDGFYRTQGGPAAHFRTSVHASPLFAAAIARLLLETDEALGRPSEIALVDVGAGSGELLEAVRAQLPSIDKHHPDHAEPAAATLTATADAHTHTTDDPVINRLRLIAVELADRPDNLTSDIEWRNDLPDIASVTGLLIANEWLDNVPCDVVQSTPEGWRVLEVATDGTERLGAAPDTEQQAWLSTWWPLDRSSDPDQTSARAEIGLSRDAAWQRAVAVLARGVAVAVDYAHVRTSRPLFGTLTGYAHGRQTVPVPDGSCDITAHVALDSCAAAAAATHAEWTIHSNQRTVSPQPGNYRRTARPIARVERSTWLSACAVSSVRSHRTHR